jgi:hypothetical protein
VFEILFAPEPVRLLTPICGSKWKITGTAEKNFLLGVPGEILIFVTVEGKEKREESHKREAKSRNPDSKVGE